MQRAKDLEIYNIRKFFGIWGKKFIEKTLKQEFVNMRICQPKRLRINGKKDYNFDGSLFFFDL